MCQHRCVIPPGKRGLCRSRENREGKLYSLIYGIHTHGIQVDNIEKKPMYHFHPGTLVASVGTFFCNFRCKQCLNWFYAQPDYPSFNGDLSVLHQHGVGITPRDLVNKVRELGCSGIAFTYNEPTIWLEYVYDTAKLAKEAGLYTVFVTNGFITSEALDFIGPHIDAYSVDFKGFSDKAYRRQSSVSKLGEIPAVTKRAQDKWGMKVEITTLIIPGINDDLQEISEMADWIVKNLGANTPWHVSRFSPDRVPDPEFRKILPTLVAVLKKCAEVGRERGLNCVFIWAPPSGGSGDFYAEGDTICPECRQAVIKRDLWQPDLSGVSEEGKCAHCGYDLDICL